MARLNSFHLPPQAWPRTSDQMAVLEGAEAHHLLRVLRAGPGERLRLFDGAGRDGLFVLERAEKQRAVLRPEALHERLEPGDRLTLALGWNKSSRRDWLLEKAVELQAGGLAFWRAERSQGEPPGMPKDSWRDKLVQAAKQCGALWLPELSVLPDGLDGLLRFAQGFERCYLLWESGQAGTVLRPGELVQGRVLAVLGPEGGLTEDEAGRLVRAGFQARSLGRSILRWETAALLCLGAVHLARQHEKPGE